MCAASELLPTNRPVTSSLVGLGLLRLNLTPAVVLYSLRKLQQHLVKAKHHSTMLEIKRSATSDLQGNGVQPNGYGDSGSAGARVIARSEPDTELCQALISSKGF